MEDIDSFILWLNDEEVRQYLGMTLPLNKIREKEWIEGIYKDDRNMVLGIVLKEDDHLIGNIGLHQISMPHRNARLGIFIGDKGYWSKGCGTEALKLLVKYGFDQLNLNRISLTVFDFNSRAIRAYEKAGFKREGVLREHMYRNGKYHDVYIMAILKSGWRERQNVTGSNL